MYSHTEQNRKNTDSRFINPIWNIPTNHSTQGNQTTLTFDISVIDIAIIIAIIVLFALYVTGNKTENTTPKRILKKLNPGKSTTRSHENSQHTPDNSNEKSDCPHHIGYLKTTKQKGIPNECMGCAKLIKCMTTEE